MMMIILDFKRQECTEHLHVPYVEKTNQPRLRKCLLAGNTRQWYKGW